MRKMSSSFFFSLNYPGIWICTCTECYSQYFASLHQALEKNQQWLVYDQQREAYVQSVVARSVELEQQLAQAKQQQTKAEESSEGENFCLPHSVIQNINTFWK